MIADEDLHRHAAENLAQADALLFGRVTYEMMEAAWRLPQRAGGDAVSAEKVVRGYAPPVAMKAMLFAVAILAIASWSCAGTEIEQVCPADLRWTMQPRDTTLRSGSSFRASLSLYGCAGTQLLSDSVTYQSSNTDVATVEPNTGIVRAFQLGDATVRARAHHYRVTDSVLVHVRAP